MTLRLLGHPVHAMLVHVPMGLLATTPLWDGIGLWRATFWQVGFWCAAVGSASALVAAVAGFVDFAGLEEGSPAERTALRHMIVMLVAVSAFAATLLFRGPSSPPEGNARFILLGIDALALAALSLGGFYGGELVYTHAVGRAPDGAASPARLASEKT